MSSWIDIVVLVLEIIKEIIKLIPKMGYAAAKSMAMGTVASRHGMNASDLESLCGDKIDKHFGK